MAAKIEQNDEEENLWNVSLCNKSWADEVDEMVENKAKLSNKKLKESSLSSRRRPEPIIEENSEYELLNVPIKQEVPKLEELPNFGAPMPVTQEKKPIKKEPEEFEDNCEYKLLAIKQEDSKLDGLPIKQEVPKLDELPSFGSHVQVTPEKKPKCREPQEFLQEDISLTGHLDKFQLASPCKTESKSQLDIKRNLNVTPTKGEGLKRKFDPTDIKNDELLMPSPSKIPKKTPSDTAKKNLTRKRLRDPATPNSDKKKRDVETDHEVIARRRKQIEYGKNTIGYDRYTSLVPRHERTKMHPKTPPMNLKFSRRAWDGLVKVWRQRLHFWDPPSEGGGNPACLDISDFSDCSSTESSLPNTPVQDVKRHKKSSKVLIEANQQDFEGDDDLNQGCTPLPD